MGEKRRDSLSFAVVPLVHSKDHCCRVCNAAACAVPSIGSQGHLHPDCPKDKIGRFRLDHDNAHWIGPYDPGHTPDDEVDFPEEEQKRADGSPYPGMHTWSPVGIIQDGLHGGPPLYHISCMYELQPIGEGEGGFGCIVVSMLC